MNDNWFLECLRWNAEEFEEAKAKAFRGDATPFEILKVWGRLFFEDGNLHKYTYYLRKILSGDESKSSFDTCQDNMRQSRFLREHSINGNLKNWFFSHCWMISGGDGEEAVRGYSSRIPRNLLYCIKNNNFDPDDEEHFTDEYFIKLLSDNVLCGLLREALQNLEDYPLLNEAIQRFKRSRNRISGSAGWYLRVNGNEARLALGITNVDYPDNYEGEKWVNINEIISGKISDGDSIFFSIEQINNNISQEEELKPKFGKKGHGQVIEVIDTSLVLKVGELNKRLEANQPLFFQVPSNPQIRDYRSIDFTKKEDIYHRRFIWIVGKEKPANVKIEHTIPLTDYPSVFCWKCELADIDNEVRSFQQNEGNILFKYQLRQPITYNGFDDELSDARHEWSIFTGDSATLTSTNNDEWLQNPIDTSHIELSKDGCSCTVKASNEIFGLRIRAHRKDYKILYIPQLLKEKIRNREPFENGAWSYTPDKDEHIDKLEHINRYRIGTLKNNIYSIQIHCDIPDIQPIAWIEPEGGGFEEFSAAECAIPQKLNSYSDLAGKYLCIAPACKTETVVIKHSDGSCEEKPLTPGKDGTVRDEIFHFMTFSGSIDPNAYDTLYWRGQEVLTVRCCPSKPELFRGKDGNWRLYVPRAKRKGYQVFFLSEKYLETIAQAHFAVVPCMEMLGDGDDEIVELTIPESLPKEYAVHACIIPQNKTPDVLNMNNDLKKVREATAEGTEFGNPAITSIILSRVNFHANFADAIRYVKNSSITLESLESFWKHAVGKISPDDLSEDIVYCMHQMLQSGYNFLCEPLSSDDCKGDYGKTWLSEAFQELMDNVIGKTLNTTSFKLDVLKDRQKRHFEPLLKVILDNQDVRSEVWLQGEGWLPPICATFFLYGKGWANQDMTWQDDNNPKVQELLEKSGIRALTIVANIFKAWKLEYIHEDLRSRTTYQFGRRIYERLNKKTGNKWIVLPNRKSFLQDQTSKYQDDEAFYPEEIIYGFDEFEKTMELTRKILEKCQKGSLHNARIIGKHLLTLFQWVCDNVNKHYVNGEEDVEHCTLGIIAIAYRLVAHIHSDDLISPDDYKFMLGIVKKAFDEKYDTRQDNHESVRRQAAIARWRYLMRCIVSVEVTIAFYNVAYTGKIEEREEKRR